MDSDERERFADAFRFALESHASQTRKGNDIPYVSHLAQVAGLVLEHGGDATAAVAALLHDVVEDCEAVDPESVRERFGDEVADIVLACTDLIEGDRSDRKSAWRARKSAFLTRLELADARTRLVAACDKLHNLRTLVADLDQEGAETLGRFSAAPHQTRWYFESVRDALGEALPPRLSAEFAALLARLRDHVPESRPDP